VVLSGQFDATDPDIDPDLAFEMNALNVSLAQFFANAVNTTNKGVDIVMDYNHKSGDHHFKILFAGNIQDMTIDQVNAPPKLSGTTHLQQTFLSPREEAFILASAPKNKLMLNLEYGYKKFAIGTRLTRFGETTILGYGDGSTIDPQVPTDNDPNVFVRDEYVYGAKLVTDLYLNYIFTKDLHSRRVLIIFSMFIQISVWHPPRNIGLTIMRPVVHGMQCRWEQMARGHLLDCRSMWGNKQRSPIPEMPIRSSD